ncbi:MAG: hypothetical protein Q8P95_00350 [bacterium]|nr:hypothetical protein [bacterium]
MPMIRRFLAFFLILPLLSGCGSGSEQPDNLIEKNLNEITAAKTPFALAKTATPVLTTSDWDAIFGGSSGTELKFDRFGEVDELVFVAVKGTFFQLQRQIRRQTRAGLETIYFKVTTPSYTGPEELWIDGRFLDLRDVRPAEELEKASIAKTMIRVRSFSGQPYTWHGSSSTGVPELLKYYPPKESLTPRLENDWILKGFSSLGMLYEASGGQTPLSEADLASFGQAVFADLDSLELEKETSEKTDDGIIRAKEVEDKNMQKTKAFIKLLKPLDIIQMGERIWIVLDDQEVIEARYRSKFAGKVEITPLLDTLHGLLGKATLVEDPLAELKDKSIQTFFIRRFADFTIQH